MAISFFVAIRPLFRETDSTQGYELDLSSYQEVRPRAPENYARLVDGSMPCDKPWPSDGWRSSGSGWMRVARVTSANYLGT